MDDMMVYHALATHTHTLVSRIIKDEDGKNDYNLLNNILKHIFYIFINIILYNLLFIYLYYLLIGKDYAETMDNILKEAEGEGEGAGPQGQAAMHGYLSSLSPSSNSLWSRFICLESFLLFFRLLRLHSQDRALMEQAFDSLGVEYLFYILILIIYIYIFTYLFYYTNIF